MENEYTNHCIRVTTVSVLQERGVSNEHIATITGHKNSSSLQHYTRHRTESTLKQINNCLNDGKTSIQIEKQARLMTENTGVLMLQNQKHSEKRNTINSESDDEGAGPSSKFVKIVGPFNNCTFNF